MSLLGPRFLSMLIALVTVMGILCSGASPASPKHRRAGSCGSAQVFLKKSSRRSIGFKVTCQLKASEGEAGFFIKRFSSTGSAGFIDFRRRLKLKGQDGSRHHGLCRRLHRSLSCAIEGRGLVTAFGEIHVRVKSRCAARVAMTLFRSTPCNGEACTSSEEAVSLFFGLPRGC